LQVGDDQIEVCDIVDGPDALLTGAGEEQVIAFLLQHQLKQAAHPFFIFNNQQFWRSHPLDRRWSAMRPQRGRNVASDLPFRVAD